MTIVSQQSPLRPILLGAFLGSVALAACVDDEPGIGGGKAGKTGTADGGEENAAGERGSVAGKGGQPTAGAGSSQGGSSAGTGGGDASGGSPLGSAGEPIVGNGGAESPPEPEPTTGGAGGEPTRGEGGQAGEGNTEPPIATACLFHSDVPPPPLDAAGGAGPSFDVAVQVNPLLGTYLTDVDGRTLYTYGNDFPGDCHTPPVSNCVADCVVSWPIFDAGARALAPGLEDAAFGSITRDDGFEQTTYYGWPLYYYKSDLLLGQLTGQGKGKTWHAAEPTPPSIVIMKVGTTKYLADGAGHTLYVSAADSIGSGSSDPVSHCTDECLTTFEPFHTKTISVVTSLEPTDFSIFASQLLGVQLAYKGMPLYRATTDVKSGTMNGTEVAGFTAAVP